MLASQEGLLSCAYERTQILNAAHHAPIPGAPSRFYALHQYRAQLRGSGILKGLSQSAALLLLALADYADPSGYCWPSMARLVEGNPISETSAKRALRELEQRGLIVREQRPGRSNLVRLVLNLPAVGDRPRTPATVEPTPAMMASEGGHGGPQKNTDPTEQRSDQQQLFAPVVVDESLNEREAIAAAEKLPRELYDQLRGIGVRAPWRLAHYGEQRIQQALGMLKQARNVTNAPGWLATCLAKGWEPAKPSAASEALTEATREHLAHVEQAKAQLADPEQAKRSKLAMVAAVVKVRRPDAARLAEMLERHGLSLDEWTVYQGEVRGVSGTPNTGTAAGE